VLVSTSAFAVETTLSCNFISSQIPYIVTFDFNTNEGTVANNKVMTEHHPSTMLFFLSEDLIWKLNLQTFGIVVIKNRMFSTRGVCERFIRKRFTNEDE
jgi:hypothetical protein